mgnify:FL=1
MRTFRILAALMMAVVCVGLSSCSKDDDSEIPSSIDNTLELLIGTWEGTGEEEGSSFTFKSDGTYVEQYGKSITNGTFEYFPYRYMFVAYFHQEYGDENVIYTVVKITEDTLILNDNGHSDIMTFKRK